MNRSEEKCLIKLAEAAKLLNCHSQTLRAWDRKGILKAVRFGERGDRRYRREDIEKLILQKK